MSDVDAQNLNGEAPLMALAGSWEIKGCSRFEHTRYAEALIDAGADLSLQRNDGMTALDIAKNNGAHHIALTIQAAIRIRLKSIALDYSNGRRSSLYLKVPITL
jgi:ankyrin repeat protein